MSKAKWEVVLSQVDKLISTSNENLYDRVSLLKSVWEDRAFLAHHNGDIDAAEEHLNAKLGDYGITIFDGLAMLREFPKRDQWASGKIRELLATALAAEESRRGERASTTTRKPPVPRKEFEALEAKMTHLNSRADSLAEENGRLRQENAQLKSDLDRALGRVEEMERVLSRQLQGA